MTSPDEPVVRSWSLRPALEEVGRARRLLEEVATGAGISHEKVFDITLACSEGIANAIEHAPPGNMVQVTTLLHTDRLEVHIEGPGAFQPPRGAYDHPRRGLGLPLMASLADHMALFSGPRGGTLLTLTFSFPCEPTESNELQALQQAERVLRKSEARYRELVENAERRRAEEALRESEEKYRTLFDSIAQGLAVIDVIFDEAGEAWNYRIVETNRAYNLKTGIVDAVGKTALELLGHVDPGFLHAYAEVALTGTPAHFENYSVALNRWFDVSAARVGAADSHRLVVIFDDITERRRAEERLRVEEQRAAAGAYARRLIEASLDPLVTIGPDGKITDVNEATINITGRERSELIGSDFSDYFTNPADARRGYREVFAKGSVTDYPLTIRSRGGKLTDVVYNATVYRDAQGEVVGVFAAARDVTARLRAEKEARRASQYNRSLIEAALDPMVTISRKGKITDVNEATCKITGRERRELVGTDFSNYFTEPERARQGYREVLAAGLVRDYPLTIQDGKGRTTDVLYNASVYKDKQGKVVGVFAAARDITALEELEAQRAIASVLQAALLDAPREIPGLRFGHLYRSATHGAQIGGDFYEVFPLKSERFGVLIGDVSGHGVEAARIATLVKDVVRAFCHESRHPRRILRRTNDLLMERQTPGFVTVFLGVLDPRARTLTYCSAGHPNALLRSRSGSVTLLEAASPPLGIFPSCSWRECVLGFNQEDLLFLYTDGAMEARRGGELFGQDRLVQALERWPDPFPERLPQAVLDEVLAFSGGELRDDVALLALRLAEDSHTRTPESGREP